MLEVLLSIVVASNGGGDSSFKEVVLRPFADFEFHSALFKGLLRLREVLLVESDLCCQEMCLSKGGVCTNASVDAVLRLLQVVLDEVDAGKKELTLETPFDMAYQHFKGFACFVRDSAWWVGGRDGFGRAVLKVFADNGEEELWVEGLVEFIARDAVADAGVDCDSLVEAFDGARLVAVLAPLHERHEVAQLCGAFGDLHLVQEFELLFSVVKTAEHDLCADDAVQGA